MDTKPSAGTLGLTMEDCPQSNKFLIGIVYDSHTKERLNCFFPSELRYTTVTATYIITLPFTNLVSAFYRQRSNIEVYLCCQMSSIKGLDVRASDNLRKDLSHHLLS